MKVQDGKEELNLHKVCGVNGVPGKTQIFTKIELLNQPTN